MVAPSGFEILYEAGPCIVVSKPGGLLTQAPQTIDSLETRVKRYLKERDQKPGNIYLAVIHRLDRPVSGAVICARHIRAARRLSEQFELRKVRKTYWACVEGIVQPATGTWRDFMRKIPDQPQAEIVDEQHAEGRLALLHYRTLGQDDRGSLLEIELETGRMHQIRLQASSRGHPILGDQQYGAQQSFGPPTDDPRARWIALHARRIVFQHPMNREQVDVTAPCPGVWPETLCPQTTRDD